MGRVDVAKDYDLMSCPVDNYIRLPKENQYWTLDYFISESLLVSNAKQIIQVMNFCNKIGAKLYLVNLLDTGWCSAIFCDQKNFINLNVNFDINGNTKYIDYGTDNMHPGPEQHKVYAEKMYELICNDENN